MSDLKRVEIVLNLVKRPEKSFEEIKEEIKPTPLEYGDYIHSRLDGEEDTRYYIDNKHKRVFRMDSKEYDCDPDEIFDHDLRISIPIPGEKYKFYVILESDVFPEEFLDYHFKYFK